MARRKAKEQPAQRRNPPPLVTCGGLLMTKEAKSKLKHLLTLNRLPVVLRAENHKGTRLVIVERTVARGLEITAIEPSGEHVTKKADPKKESSAAGWAKLTWAQKMRRTAMVMQNVQAKGV